MIAAAAFIIAIIIILHHSYTHRMLPFPRMFMEFSDIDNHETWAIASLAFAIGAYLGDI